MEIQHVRSDRKTEKKTKEEHIWHLEIFYRNILFCFLCFGFGLGVSDESIFFVFFVLICRFDALRGIVFQMRCIAKDLFTWQMRFFGGRYGDGGATILIVWASMGTLSGVTPQTPLMKLHSDVTTVVFGSIHEATSWDGCSFSSLPFPQRLGARPVKRRRNGSCRTGCFSCQPRQNAT